MKNVINNEQNAAMEDMMSDMAMAASYINGWMDDHEPLAWHDVAVAKGMFDMALYLVGLSDADVIESIIENDIPRIK